MGCPQIQKAGTSQVFSSLSEPTDSWAAGWKKTKESVSSPSHVLFLKRENVLVHLKIRQTHKPHISTLRGCRWIPTDFIFWSEICPSKLSYFKRSWAVSFHEINLHTWCPLKRLCKAGRHILDCEFHSTRLCSHKWLSPPRAQVPQCLWMF